MLHYIYDLTPPPPPSTIYIIQKQKEIISLEFVTMGFQAEEVDHSISSTPKLTLSKFPYCKSRSEAPPPLHMQTPPLLPSVSIPFHWEEAPGKPRAAALRTPPSSKSKAARCLELPPRLMLQEDAGKITMMPSPTSVLDGPYVGRSLSLACTFSFRKGVGLDGPRPVKRWRSFREEMKFGGGERESLDFSQSLGDIFRSEDENNVKMTRVRRRRSFFSLSTINSSKFLQWGDIYASLKQAVPWRRSRP